MANNTVSLPTVDLLTAPGYTPTLRENLVLGVGKAHRTVNYSHYDYRNQRRSGGMPKGVLWSDSLPENENKPIGK